VFRNLLLAFVVIVPVTLIVGALTYFRAEALTEENTPEATSPEGESSAPNLTLAAVAFSVIFGLIATLVYTWMVGRWPGATFRVYLGLAIGLTLFFNIAAVIVRVSANLGGIPECVMLNTLFGVGYGWLLPLLLN
jgi:hypothetical protein